MKNPYVFGAVLVAISVVASAFLIRPVQNVVNQAPGVDLGSVVGPDSYFPVETHNGVAWAYSGKVGFNSATTTVVAVKSPSATSTLQVGSGCNFILASTSAKSVRFAKATTAFATTTFLFGAPIAAGAQGYVAATTTTDNFVFAPNNYLVASLVGGAGVDSPTGACSVYFQY